MKLSRRTNTIILWVISIGLLVSMVIAFTPTLGGLFGSGPGGAGLNNNSPALLVNGKAITELEVARALQGRGHSSFEGEVGEDLDLLALDGLIQNEVLEQAASGIRVGDGEVRTAVNEWREQQGVAGRGNDQRYLSLIGQAGFDDQSFRQAFRNQIRSEKYREQLTEGIEVSDNEAQAFYELNVDRYQSEERIKARQIVVEDESLATELSQRIAEGEDFSALAEEFSVERADRAGALGAPEGSTEPQAVGRAALPTIVASRAFGLLGSGVTDVISFNERFYLIDVEEFIEAGTRPFEEVEESVREDALAAKEAALLESTFTDLRNNAQISPAEGSTYSFDDEVVAKVGDEEIMRSELARVVYNDPQVSQALRPDTASIITGLFKPSYLQRLIDSELAFQGASDLDAQFLGNRSQIAQSALNFVSKDATATDEDYQTYYDDNIARFTIPASATASRVNFETEEEALAFREAMLEGGELLEIAEANGGAVVDLGIVRPGSLAPELDRVLFETEGFESLEDGNDISDIIVLTETVEQPLEDIVPEGNSEDSAAEEGNEEAAEGEEVTAEDTEENAEEASSEESTEEASEASSGDEETAETAEGEGETAEVAEVAEEVIDTYVVLIAERTPETIRPFEEVSGQVETAVLQSKQSELQTAWLDGLRETITIENLLADAAVEAAPEAGFETTPIEGSEDNEESPADAEETSESEGSNESGEDTEQTEGSESESSSSEDSEEESSSEDSSD